MWLLCLSDFISFSKQYIGILYIQASLVYMWASLVAQLVKNLPAMQEIWVGFLGWGDSVEKGWATYSSILALPLWLS